MLVLVKHLVRVPVMYGACESRFNWYFLATDRVMSYQGIFVDIVPSVAYCVDLGVSFS